MLTDNQIDKLIQPVLTRQTQIESLVLLKLAKRINEVGTLLPSDINMLAQLRKSGSDVAFLKKELARLTHLQERRIRKIIRVVAANNYADAKPFYEHRRLNYIPFDKNPAMQSIVKAMEEITVGEYINIANSTALAFAWRDPISGVVTELLGIEQTYYKAVDIAIQAVSTGITDYSTAMRKTLRSLVDSGLNTVTYQSKKGKITHQRLDTAVRRNLIDGVRSVSQAIQDEIGKQVNADGVELTAHMMSAPDHEPIQGHQFTVEEYSKCQNQMPFQDVDGQQFAAINRPIGVWNCRHFAYSIILGVVKPTYTKEQLEQYKKKNAQGYTYTDSKGNEHHLTLYECAQRQRNMELGIRKLREGEAVARRAGDDALADIYKARIRTKLYEYTAFSNSCGLKPQYVRTKVIT